MQPLQVLVVQSEEAKDKLATACQQPQIKESGKILIFCIWDKLDEGKVDAYLANIAEARAQDVASLEPFKNMISSFTAHLDEKGFQEWAAKQAYINLGFGLYAAALEKVDSTPMEGFNSAVLDEVFQLKERGLKSVVLLALGNRDESTDYLSSAKKVRRSHDSYFEFL